ncbi:hypothetical protein MPER_10235 [Moniliophthora perniciosa FA553]|nr:hypothetical protein MPER_10235 [Moniliophthora perniciosa FA553]
MTEEFSRFLPQHGFGPDVNFDTIVRYHPFLFRVYTPRTRSPHNDDSIFFIGAQFDAKFAPKTPVMSGIHGPAGSLLDAATYEDCLCMVFMGRSVEEETAAKATCASLALVPFCARIAIRPRARLHSAFSGHCIHTTAPHYSEFTILFPEAKAFKVNR